MVQQKRAVHENRIFHQSTKLFSRLGSFPLYGIQLVILQCLLPVGSLL